jgi:hypothetical protein
VWDGDDSKCLNKAWPIPDAGYKGAIIDCSMMDKAGDIFRTPEKKGIDAPDSSTSSTRVVHIVVWLVLLTYGTDVNH